MEFIVLRHLSGSKANREDRFALERFEEITIGRDPSSSVRFNEETDAMVGRQHAKITRNPALPSLFFIIDLDSRNGTFINQQRIFERASLKPGDVVQCGISGPEFRFEVETEMQGADTPQHPIANPVQQTHETPANPNLSPAASAFTNFTPIDAARPTAEGEARKRVIMGGVVLVGLVALAVGYAGYRGPRSKNLGEAEKLGVAPNISPTVSTTSSPTDPPAASPVLSPDAGAKKYDDVRPPAVAEVEKKGAGNKTTVAAAKTAGAIKRNAAPRRGRVTSAGSTKNAGVIGGKGAVKSVAPASSGKNKQSNHNTSDATMNGKKDKKAKKEKKKKVKY